MQIRNWARQRLEFYIGVINEKNSEHQYWGFWLVRELTFDLEDSAVFELGRIISIGTLESTDYVEICMHV